MEQKVKDFDCPFPNNFVLIPLNDENSVMVDSDAVVYDFDCITQTIYLLSFASIALIKLRTAHRISVTVRAPKTLSQMFAHFVLENRRVPRQSLTPGHARFRRARPVGAVPNSYAVLRQTDARMRGGRRPDF
jgi:hypothetical protein